jgi:hypothetical protein
VDIAKLRADRRHDREGHNRGPRELGRCVAEFEQQFAIRVPTIAQVAERVKVPVLRDDQIERFEQVVNTLSKVEMQLVSTAQKIADARGGSGTGEVMSSVLSRHVTARPGRTDPAPQVVTPTDGSANTAASQLRAGEHRMLQFQEKFHRM